MTPEDKKLRRAFVNVTMIMPLENTDVFLNINNIGYFYPVYDELEYAGTRVYTLDSTYFGTVKEKLWLHPAIEGQWDIKPDNGE